MKHFPKIAPFLLLTLLLYNFQISYAADPVGQVTAVVETDPVPTGDDAADDPAIWIHPTDPTQSTIIGTDKDSGVGVYDLAGNELQFLTDGRLNNVDLRYNFPLGGQSVALVTAGNRSDNSIAIYRMNPTTRRLEDVAARTIKPGVTIYGSCMYHSLATGKYYLYATSKSGQIEQWELFDDGNDQVDAAKVRSFDVGAIVEGCVADDELAHFYAGEEDKGIWKYGAEPEDGTSRTQVDQTGSGGHLTADVEGLTLYYAGDGTGYLIASSQGNSKFVVYQREGNNEYVTTFEIVAGNGIDRVSGTDGIDVTNFPLGSAFPEGVFVAQDDDNDGSHQNFKLVPWSAVAEATSTPLTIDTSWDPRQVGGGDTSPSPTPEGTYLDVEPVQNAAYPGDTVAVSVTVHNAENLYGLQVHCAVDPAVLAWQTAQFDDFFTDPIIGSKNLEATAGTWTGAISQKNPAPALSGDGAFATFTFEAVAPGSTTITCDPIASDRNGYQLPISALSETITVFDAEGGSGGIQGDVTLQGRLDHTGIDMTATGPSNKTTRTNSAGQFEINALMAGSYEAKVDAPLYLPSCTTATVLAGQVTTLASTVLSGGDTDDDDQIRINDATLIGSNFGLDSSTSPAMDSRADINADGKITVQDLSILGGNFGQQGCQDWVATSPSS